LTIRKAITSGSIIIKFLIIGRQGTMEEVCEGRRWREKVIGETAFLEKEDDERGKRISIGFDG
jgi:hypothetical protein